MFLNYPLGRFRSAPEQTRINLLRRCHMACDDIFKTLRRQTKTLVDIKPLYLAFALNQQLHATVTQFGEVGDPKRFSEVLRTLEERMQAALLAEPWENHDTRLALTVSLESLQKAHLELAPCIPRRQDSLIAAPNQPLSVLMPTDLLHQAQFSLFPAERMLVISGIRDNGLLRLQSLFDVTGKTQVTRVWADPGLLANAMIAMDRAGSHFAAWGHSHPGTGPFATYPSDIDRTQYMDLIRDFSLNLVNFILVEDGYCRFWGTAVEEGRVSLSFQGRGITTENADEHLYRLEL